MSIFNGSNSQWNDESRKAAVPSLLADGFSYGRIAAELGTTRSAIAGLIKRMGLVKNPRGSRIPLTDAQRADKDRERHLANLAQRRRRSAETKADAKMANWRPSVFRPRSAALPLPPKNLSFNEMDFRFFCSYPTHTLDAPATYCGHDRGLARNGEKSSYCEGHHRLAHA